MIFKKDELLRVFDIASTIIDSNSGVPILQNICFNKTYISGVNIDSIGFFVNFDCGELECLIPFKKFFVFVKYAKTDEIDVSYENGNIVLKEGNSVSNISTEPIEDFPVFTSSIDNIKETGIKGNVEILEGLKLCLPFVGKNMSRTVLNGINFKNNMIAATDGIKIGEYKLSDNFGYDSVFDLNFVKVVLKLNKVDLIFVDKEKVVFNDGDFYLFGSLIDGEFPNVSTFFPKVKKFVKLPKEQLIEGLKKVGDFTGEIQGEAECTLDFGDILSIKYKSSVAEISEFFDFGKELPKGSFVINPYYFMMLLKYCDSFAFLKEPHIMFYAQTKDARFKCVMSMKVSK